MIEKKQNQEIIFQFIKERGEVTRQDISSSLNLSMPTVLHNVDTLIKRNLIYEAGANESTGGRRAMKLCINRQAAFVIGVEVALHHVTVILTDLSGEIVGETSMKMRFVDEMIWYDSLASEVEQLLHKCKLDYSQILGCGISFPGIIDNDAEYIVKSHILNVENIDFGRFKKAIPVPIIMANDANCACVAENRTKQAVYLYISLNESVGGAFMVNGQLYMGDTFQSCEIGHVILEQGGRKCYCGKQGCADAYLSPLALLKNEKNLDEFFDKLSGKDERAEVLFGEYMNSLAVFISNLRMIMNTDIVIGGELSSYLEPYLDLICSTVKKYDLFARDVDYISISQVKKLSCAIGAALLAMERYSDHLMK